MAIQSYHFPYKQLVNCLSLIVAVLLCLNTACNKAASESSSIAKESSTSSANRENSTIIKKATNSKNKSAKKPRILGDLLKDKNPDGTLDPVDATFTAKQTPPKIDDEKLTALGIRKITSKHLTLYTDLPPEETVDELPAVFDLATPQWQSYFEIDDEKMSGWHMTGYLMKDKQRFRKAGLFPETLPPFLHGFQSGPEFWLYDQPSSYYRRHLLLHEGTHAFMNRHLGGTGPPWYMEGTAELLGTHLWENGKLTIGTFPKDRDQTPQWGRIKIVKDEFKAERGMSLPGVMNYGTRAHLRNEPYGWCWAVAAFFDGNPQSRQAFRQMKEHVAEPNPQFSNRLQQQLQADWPHLQLQWRLFVQDIHYGYDIARATIDEKEHQVLPSGGATIALKADRGWQSTGFELDKGTTYKITASGRYQVGDQPSIWWSEPQGVTIRYHKGHPLGMLMGAIYSLDEETGAPTLSSPGPLGIGREITSSRDGVLYLRINEAAAGLSDNAGELIVRIEKL